MSVSDDKAQKAEAKAKTMSVSDDKAQKATETKAKGLKKPCETVEKGKQRTNLTRKTLKKPQKEDKGKRLKSANYKDNKQKMKGDIATKKGKDTNGVRINAKTVD